MQRAQRGGVRARSRGPPAAVMLTADSLTADRRLPTGMAADSRARVLQPSPRTSTSPTFLAGSVVVVAVAGVLAAYVGGGPLAALALSLAVTLAAGALAAPRGFRIAASIAFATLPFLVVVPSLRPDDLKFPILLCIGVMALVLLGAFQPRMIAPSLGSLFLAYMSLAALVATLRRTDLGGFTGLAFVVLAFGMYTLVRRGDRGERRIVLAALLGLGVAEASMAVLQTLVGWPVFSLTAPILYQSERNYLAYVIPGLSALVTQGSGTFDHFNQLGALLSACLPVALGLWLHRRRSWWYLGATVVLAAGLVATFSRGAVLGAVIGVLFVLWFGPQRSRRASIALLVGVVLLFGVFAANMLYTYYETTQNASIRVETWQRALDDVLDRPSDLAVGSGFGYFHQSLLASGRGGETLTQQTTYMSTLHSSHLQLLLEFGLLGVVLGVAWILSAMRKVTTSASPVAVAALGGGLGVLASQALDNALFGFVGVVLAMLVAVAEGEALDGAGDAGAPSDGASAV